jgi:hypothetical protein
MRKKGRNGKNAGRRSAKPRSIAKNATVVRRKRASKKKGTSRKGALRTLTGTPADLRTVTFESFPKTGMTMKVDMKLLTTNPQSLLLTPGDHLLQWTFVGPPGAEFTIHVTGALMPRAPITDRIAEGENMAAGYYDVLV